MIQLSQFIPLDELGDGNATPFMYDKKFTRNGLSFKDEQGDKIDIELSTYSTPEQFEISSAGHFLYTPSNTIVMGFNVNNVSVDDYKDDNAKAKKTDLNYYLRLIATLKNIISDMVDTYHPNVILAGKYNSNKINRQKETRYEMYARLFNSINKPGYKSFSLENNTVVGIAKSEIIDKKLIYIK